MSFVWLNGELVEESAASISLRDVGLLHGAGVFTTMRAVGGKVFRLAAHLKRLRASCEALFIPLVHKEEQLTSAVAELLARSALRDARLRLTVTRGISTPDPLHGVRLEPNVFLTCAAVEPYPAEYYEQGMTVVVVDEYKLNPYDLLAGHKALNYFPRLHVLRDAARLHAGEALWFDVHHYLQSGSISNVFIVKDDELFTPPTPQEMRESLAADALPYPKSCVLPGITRAAVMELARGQKLDVHLSAIDLRTLLDSDEVFLCNSIMQVMPVCRVERKSIGGGTPGPITLRLMEALAKQVEGEADGGAAPAGGSPA